ncbi:TetR/AcrR family transcriptional regulator [Streptomyces sp. NPDC051815]|uniref:TetR/AcrR family transcriptional regulator n=1 Tax=Streptomyces sp. NPDC051815 TaxID=3365674 RepID=UPI0037BA8276
MRPSARTRILEAAVRVTERDGITALTLQSAAEEAGVTKPGLMDHFRTRQALLVAIQRTLTLRWESLLAPPHPCRTRGARRAAGRRRLPGTHGVAGARRAPGSSPQRRVIFGVRRVEGSRRVIKPALSGP